MSPVLKSTFLKKKKRKKKNSTKTQKTTLQSKSSTSIIATNTKFENHCPLGQQVPEKVNLVGYQSSSSNVTRKKKIFKNVGDGNSQWIIGPCGVTG